MPALLSDNRSVFVNCPFDPDYKPLLWALLYAVIRSGFVVRCALEADDASVNRFQKIIGIIKECRYGIHDISRTEPDGDPPLPRFNMPLELGLFLGAKAFGSSRAQRSKSCIIFDRDRHRYQRYISDLAGQDIHAHEGDAAVLIEQIAAWFRTQNAGLKGPGGRAIAAEFRVFMDELPDICATLRLHPEELTFSDLSGIIASYVADL